MEDVGLQFKALMVGAKACTLPESVATAANIQTQEKLTGDDRD